MSMDIIEKIKNAFETIANSLPIDSDRFIEMFNDLTNCEIVYDVFPKIEKVEKITDRVELRVFYAKDRVYCVESGVEIEYVIEAKVIDYFDKYKTIAKILEYRVLNITLAR